MERAWVRKPPGCPFESCAHMRDASCKCEDDTRAGELHLICYEYPGMYSIVPYVMVYMFDTLFFFSIAIGYMM